MAAPPVHGLLAVELDDGDGREPWDTKALETTELKRLRDANPAVTFIYWGNKREIDSNYAVVSVYGEPGSPDATVTDLSKSKIGVFVVDQRSSKIVITLDIFKSGLYPFVHKATQNEAIAAFSTDYREMARKRYVFDLKTLKLVRSTDLPPAEWTGKCDHDGKIEDCYD